ncbi:NUDIX domain-containing protein [Skermania piniformis]
MLLLRDGRAGLEVFLQRRVAGMAFAGGMTVFPGGGVDPADGELAIGWSGPDVGWWAEQFGVTASRAQALVCAAVRETFEECGVLLAGPTADLVVADTGDYQQARRRLERRELSLAEFLVQHDLVLRADLLRPWANWITPVGEQRRYDTRFFVAGVPPGQHADGLTTEAADVGWRRPADALADWSAGVSILLPPTWSQLRLLAGYPDLATVLAAEPAIEPVEPELDVDGDVVTVYFDGQDEYYAAGVHPWTTR